VGATGGELAGVPSAPTGPTWKDPGVGTPLAVHSGSRGQASSLCSTMPRQDVGCPRMHEETLGMRSGGPSWGGKSPWPAPGDQAPVPP
jgi:hypothetical protein